MEPPGYVTHAFICTHTRDPTNPRGSCGAKGSVELLKRARVELRGHEVHSVRIQGSGCLNHCEQGPCAVIYPEGTWMTSMDSDVVKNLVERVVQRAQQAS